MPATNNGTNIIGAIEIAGTNSLGQLEYPATDIFRYL